MQINTDAHNILPNMQATNQGNLFWAPMAWLPASRHNPDHRVEPVMAGALQALAPGDGAWFYGVCLEADAHGYWKHIGTGIHTAPPHATVLAGPALPGLVNAHSHAFQRAFAGLSERRTAQSDDFWSWRDRMYGVALRITPAQMRAVAAQLYVEMLQGGYTQVCEFHYLHHSEDGTPYADPACMAWAVAEGAADAGLGITLLPVLYERAGFAAPALREDQRRFAGTPDFVTAVQRSVAGAGKPLVNAGVAIHSLRAASAPSIHALMQRVADQDMPVHVHVAEQMQEVHDCLAHTGQRPIAWLCQHLHPDARWQLVHATHAVPGEIESVAQTGAGIVLCPATEGNLGDGLTDLPGWLAAGVPMAIGSDSHVCRNAMEELRWLEYGQRLQLQRRNVCAAPEAGQSATAARLFDAALQAGARAAGQKHWGLEAGARADLVVLDNQAPGLLATPPGHTLDACMFACDNSAVRDVWVAGRPVLEAGRHARQTQIARQFADAMIR